MRKIVACLAFLCLLLPFAGARAAQPVQPVGVSGRWSLAFDDEFNAGSLNTAVWQANWNGAYGALTPPVNSAETDCYDPNQVVEGNGELDLTAVNIVCAPGNGKTYPHRSGLVETNGKYEFSYGVFEARLWTPAGTGVWPAFWSDGQNWPTNGEIDVVEAYGTPTSSYHYHYASRGVAQGPGGSAIVAGATSGWHTYSADWQPGKITWYYDGHLVWTWTTGVVSSPQYLILDLGLNSLAPVLPATLRVDYVRVWRAS